MLVVFVFSEDLSKDFAHCDERCKQLDLETMKHRSTGDAKSVLNGTQ